MSTRTGTAPCSTATRTSRTLITGMSTLKLAGQTAVTRSEQALSPTTVCLLQTQGIRDLAVTDQLPHLEDAAYAQGRLAVRAHQSLAEQHVARGTEYIGLTLHPCTQGSRTHVVNLQA